MAGRFAAAEEGGSKERLWSWGLNNAGQLGVVDLENRFEPTLVRVIQGKEVSGLAVGGSDRKESHVLALVFGTKLYAFGDNSQGQLGVGDNLDREGLAPLPSVFANDFVGISSGESHSIAVTREGEVFVWGSNEHGQLGLNLASGSRSTATVPERLKGEPFGPGSKVVGVACGSWHSFAWLESGELFAWGDNSYGQLGIGSSKKSVSGPVKVKLPLAGGETVRSISSGGTHNLLLTTGGKVYAWGKNDYSQLGLGKNAGSGSVHEPTLVKGLGRGVSVQKVVAGQTFGALLTTKGEVYAFGDNSALQLGSKLSSAVQKEPKVMPSDAKFKDLSCGKLHCLAATTEGLVFVWGTDSYGQLGLGASKRSLGVDKPERVGGLESIAKVFASATGSYAVSARGELYAWGKNNAGQLGIRSTKNPKSEPETVVEVSEGSRIKSMSAGGHAFQYEGHSAVIMSSGEVYTWGWNFFAQLGNGESESRQGIPHAIPWLARLNLTSIACGQFSTAAVTEEGELYMWGSNEAGQLGRGDFAVTTSDPIKIPIQGKVKAVSIGYGHVLAVTTEGKVFSWGKNFYGQLGVGDHRDKATPQPVTHLQEETVVDVSAGQYHSLALTAKGGVFAWGYNREYELGLNDNMDRVLPQGVTTLRNRKISQVSAGSYHNLALAEDGSILSWGLNNYEQLGRVADKYGKFPGSVSVTATPSKEHQGGRKVRATKVAAGGWHSLALGEDGHVYSWGRCHFGQVGSRCDADGSNTKGVQTFPARVVQLEGMRATGIAAGAAHSMAITAAAEEEER
ncbi:RCC1 -like regulator of chromosome condensation protein [Chloropicon primus]|uniref:RCC1-like regulator of chromosome condensation protein n=1 Tax=Chloropicon primus TaxID=1764295 RepID=A0A5B8MKK1_9CHLO|nr:RCC1 -like regulator of chromosome condensation protein [Chloropicon primus]UPR00372.1 RCC1 -like regulator of chromosome condensation protein [Chloropicon primus]|eukprot:QDZ21158.1 RCC1 -like regulator of chromosome condensation protein [Chloropicon primus]